MIDRPWQNIDYCSVHDLYEKRFDTHLGLKRAFEQGKISAYAELALGINDPSGNYSAAEHGLGPQILARSTAEQVFELAKKLFRCASAESIPMVIYSANLPFLKIGVGSEMAAMLRPDAFWVTNVRTTWAHLIVKNNGDVAQANQELRLYRDDERDSEMDYRIWSELHKLVGPSLEKLYKLSTPEAAKQSVEFGDLRFLWADAIADVLYNNYALFR